jgi:hypothetical protein
MKPAAFSESFLYYINSKSYFNYLNIQSSSELPTERSEWKMHGYDMCCWILMKIESTKQKFLKEVSPSIGNENFPNTKANVV